VPSLREHPLPRLVAAGVRCTVSTDDPFSFGNTITEEYGVLASEMGFGRAALARTARAGFEVALVDEATRARWLADVDAAAAQP
jgi:adenosine deaminase